MNSGIKNKLIGLAVTIVFVLAIWIPAAYPARKLPIVRIGMVRDGPVARLPDYTSLVKEEILRLTSREFNVLFPADKKVHGSWKTAKIKRAIDALLTDPEVDLVIGLGFLASNDLCHRKNLPKPAIAAAIIDRKLQNIPLREGTSGVKNLTYIDPFFSYERDISVFRDMVPFNSLVVLISKAATESIPWIEKKLREVSYEHTIDIHLVEVGFSAEEALSAFPPEADAAYVMPLAQLSPGEFRKLVYGLIQLRLPSFSVLGRDDVEAGLLASVAPQFLLRRIGRRIALNTQRIILGENPSTFRVAFPLGEKLTINMATGRAIGFYPTWSALTEAVLLNEKVEEVQRRYTLESAVLGAIEANLELAAINRNVAAGEQLVKEARSVLLPQVDLGARGEVIDEDRAQARGGIQPERSLTGGVTATQLIYDEDSWSNYSVEKNLQTSREEERDTTELDVIGDTAVAYLNVLRAKTLERVERSNLEVTRANLDRARVRVATGVANRSEEFRWTAEVAGNRAEVLFAQARTRQSEDRLNQLLNRPIEEKFIAEEADLKDPLLIVSDPRIYRYVGNPMSFRIYRDFVVEQGLGIAPELKGFDAAIKAQNRILSNAKRAFWLPSFAARGNVTELLAEDGAGQRNLSIQDNTDWSVGLFATFPLIEGGSKFAVIKRAREELSRLTLERQATGEQIERRIRSALHAASASYPNIGLSRDAAEAAGKNLDLVTDQYVRGVVSIVDLIDAQDSALISEQNAQNAVYDFLVDWMNVGRASGQFDFLMNSAEKEEWFQDLEIFFEKSGLKLRRR